MDLSFFHSFIHSRTHVNGLEQVYSIGFIWGPDYQTEYLKGGKGVGAVYKSKIYKRLKGKLIWLFQALSLQSAGVSVPRFKTRQIKGAHP